MMMKYLGVVILLLGVLSCVAAHSCYVCIDCENNSGSLQDCTNIAKSYNSLYKSLGALTGASSSSGPSNTCITLTMGGIVQKSCGVNALDAFVKEGCNKYYDLFPQMRNVGNIGGGVGGFLGDLEDAEFCKCTGNACNGAIATTNAMGATILSAIFCIFHIIF